MSRLILFNKPFEVLSQFTDRGSPTTRQTLSDYIKVPGVYPAGRLDRDSEGLLLLTDDGRLQARIADPKFKLPKTYWVQVEGDITDEALAALRAGVMLNDGMTRPARAERIEAPDLWQRDPPVRFRKSVPDCWISLTIAEGRPGPDRDFRARRPAGRPVAGGLARRATSDFRDGRPAAPVLSPEPP